MKVTPFKTKKTKTYATVKPSKKESLYRKIQKNLKSLNKEGR